jgi:hypothetical protein
MDEEVQAPVDCRQPKARVMGARPRIDLCSRQVPVGVINDIQHNLPRLGHAESILMQPGLKTACKGHAFLNEKDSQLQLDCNDIKAPVKGHR